MKKIFLAMILCVSSYGASKIETSKFLEDVKNDKYVFAPYLINPQYLPMIEAKQKSKGGNLDSGLISKYETRQKVNYPKWDWDLLYYKVAVVDDMEYRIGFDVNTRACILVSDPRQKMESYRKCEIKINQCVMKLSLKGEVQRESVYKCYKQPGCQFEKFSESEVVDKSICEQLYSRKL